MESLDNEKKERKKNKVATPKRVTAGLISLGILCLAGSLLLRFSTMLEKRDATVITSSTLTDTINISELSTAEFIYNGIAQEYEEGKKEKVKCNISYYATVKAGIDMQDVKFDIDKNEKTVKPILPKIEITSNVVDNKPMDYIPSDTKIELKEAIRICEEDALQEASKASELTKTAEESLKANIEVLLQPILQKNNYKLIWD